MNSTESRAERLRRVNRHKALQAEIARQKEEQEFDRMRVRQSRAAERDAALANELAEQQRLDLKDEKMLLFVKNLPEVRALEQELKGAYLRKSRAEQVADVRAAKQNEVREQRQYVEYLDAQDREAEREEEQRRVAEVEAFRRHQEAQLELIRQHRAAAVEEANERQKERIAVDAVVARVQERDFLDSLARRERQRQIREEQDEFNRLRQELKDAERAREAKEEAAIVAYLKEQSRRKEESNKLAQERNLAKTRILEEQGRRLMEEHEKKRELEDLLHDYYEEERRAKEMALMKTEKESRQRMADRVMKENLDLIQLRKEAKEAEIAEEMRYRQELMEQLAIDAKLEQLSRERQMQLRKEHIAETQRRLEERRRLKEEEQRLAQLVEEQNRKRDDELNEYIRRARAQLLEQHLPKLGSYAPVRALNEDEKTRFFPTDAQS